MREKILALTRFNERVDQLSRSDLAKRFEDPNYTLDYERMIKGEWISFDGVTEDSVGAFVLNLRFLVQDRDGFSIRRLYEDVYSQDSVPVELRDRFATQRRIWRELMKSPSTIKHITEDRNYGNGEIFDSLMYGGLVHVNSEKVELFSALTKQGAVSSFVFGWFLYLLRAFLDIVRAIREVNTELLNHWNC